jgi:Leucine-rich repeat (LRR) protein
MRWLTTTAAVIVAAFLSPSTASAITFSEWATNNGYSPGDVMPAELEIDEYRSPTPITSLSGLGDYNWTATPTTRLFLNHNQISSIETGAFNGLSELTELQIWNNPLTSMDLSGLSNLDHLRMQWTSITSLGDIDLSGAPHLTNLAVQEGLISSIETGDLSGVPNLKELWLSAASAAIRRSARAG